MRANDYAPRSLISFVLRCAGAVALAAVAAMSIAGQNQTPSVTLTSPANGASFAAPATIPLAATASDPDGTVVRVDFYSGTTLIGTSTTPPYTATWSNVPAGSYSVTAKAIDNKGAVGTSSAATVAVSSATALVITNPADGAFINVDAFSITVAGTYEGPTTGNTILIDNPTRSSLATITNNSYSAGLLQAGSDFNVGPNTLTVRLERADRTNVTRSITVHGYANTAVAFTAPSSATFTAPATVTFAVDAVAPGGAVTQVVFVKNEVTIATVTSPPYQVTLSKLGSGYHTVYAFATSNRGPIGTASAEIQVLGPNIPPEISIASPTSGTIFSQGSNVQITVNASDPDGSVTLVEYFANGAPIGTTNLAPFTFIWTNPAAGNYTLTARATDNRSGQTTSAPVNNISVVPPNQLPSVSLTSPASGATFTAPATVNLAATASDPDGSVTKVEFFQGTTLLATVTTPPYTFAWTNVAAGSYSLTAKATDNLGGLTTSAPVPITVNPAPITITSPGNGATLTGTSVLVAGTIVGPSGSGVTVNGIVAAIDTNQNFYTIVPVVQGSNTLTATLTTLDGQTATQSISVTGDGVAPLIEISPDRIEGIAPLTVNFKLAGAGPFQGQVQVTGGGVTVTSPDPSTLAVTYANSGTFPTTITITDTLNNTVVRNFVIVVHDQAQANQSFKALWNGMNNALIAGNKTTALTYLTGPAQSKYGPVFDVLMPHMAGIAATYGEPQFGTYSEEITEYAVGRTINGVRYVFLIYFVRDLNGVWRLDSM